MTKQEIILGIAMIEQVETFKDKILHIAYDLNRYLSLKGCQFFVADSYTEIDENRLVVGEDFVEFVAVDTYDGKRPDVKWSIPTRVFYDADFRDEYAIDYVKKRLEEKENAKKRYEQWKIENDRKLFEQLKKQLEAIDKA